MYFKMIFYNVIGCIAQRFNVFRNFKLGSCRSYQ
ncbi:hypothetical protein IBT54_001431 [Pantoea sp. S62]|nr:hypothetical protein [Pantoea sp. S62]